MKNFLAICFFGLVLSTDSYAASSNTIVATVNAIDPSSFLYSLIVPIESPL